MVKNLNPMPNLAENLDKKEADQEELIQAEVVQPQLKLVLPLRYQWPKKASNGRLLASPREVENLDKKEWRPGRNRDRRRRAPLRLGRRPNWWRSA